LTREPHSAGQALRKFVAAVILVPLAIVIIAFAVANRQIVTVSLDPFSSEHPASSLTLPLFALILVLLIVGVVIAAWRLGCGKRSGGASRGGWSARWKGCAAKSLRSSVVRAASRACRRPPTRRSGFSCGRRFQ